MDAVAKAHAQIQQESLEWKNAAYNLHPLIRGQHFCNASFNHFHGKIHHVATVMLSRAALMEANSTHNAKHLG